jgi:hypothetical protein
MLSPAWDGAAAREVSALLEVQKEFPGFVIWREITGDRGQVRGQAHHGRREPAHRHLRHDGRTAHGADRSEPAGAAARAALRRSRPEPFPAGHPSR